MTRIHVIGHRRALDPTLRCLQELGVVHLVDVTSDPGVHLPPLAVDETHQQETEELRYLRARLDATLSLAPTPPVASRRHDPTADEITEVREELDERRPYIEDLVRRLDELDTERESLPRYVASLRRLLPLAPELIDLAGYETSALLIDRRHAAVLAEVNAELTELLGSNFEILSDQVDADTVGAILVFPHDRAPEVQAILGHEHLSRVQLPARYQDVPFRDAIVAMERHLADIPAQTDAVRSALNVELQPRTSWAEASDFLQRRMAQLDALKQLGATPHTFVVSGWIPDSELERLEEYVGRRVGSDVIVEAVATPADDNPPVLMYNPAPARPFEFLVRLLALPRYGSLDPTTLMMLFLPLFFGMMLGDVAYGAILLTLAVLVYRRFGGRSAVAHDLSLVFMMSSGWTIVWGVIYGELLGDLGHRVFGLEPIWINREEALEPLLVFAIAVGGAHVVLALILGVWEAARGHNRHDLTERLALLLALIGLFLFAGAAAERLPSGAATPAVAALVVAVVVLMSTGGAIGILMGPLELLGTIGNVLSYLRIAAIGLASVFLAKVANELGAAAPLWLGIIVASLFHALNLALGAFSPTIQALRLHYVEFFGKFYAEGGEPFQPFGSESTKSQTLPHG